MTLRNLAASPSLPNLPRLASAIHNPFRLPFFASMLSSKLADLWQRQYEPM